MRKLSRLEEAEIKKNNTRRPIGNPLLNSMFQWTYKLDLDPPEAILELAFGYSHACVKDFQGWFNQLPLISSVRPLFTMQKGKHRFMLKVLPQGFTGAPFLAQRVTDIVLNDTPTSSACIYNILLVGSSQDLPLIHQTVLDRADLIGAVFKD